MLRNTVYNNIFDPDRIDVAETVMEDVSFYSDSSSQSNKYDLPYLGNSEKSRRNSIGAQSIISNEVPIAENNFGEVVADDDINFDPIKSWSEIKFGDQSVELFNTEYIGDGNDDY